MFVLIDFAIFAVARLGNVIPATMELILSSPMSPSILLGSYRVPFHGVAGLRGLSCCKATAPALTKNETLLESTQCAAVNTIFGEIKVPLQIYSAWRTSPFSDAQIDTTNGALASGSSTGLPKVTPLADNGVNTANPNTAAIEALRSFCLTGLRMFFSP